MPNQKEHTALRKLMFSKRYSTTHTMLTHWPMIGKPSFEMIRSSPTAAQSSTTPYFRQLQVQTCNQVCTQTQYTSVASCGRGMHERGCNAAQKHKQRSTSIHNTGTPTICENNISTLILSSSRTTATKTVEPETATGKDLRGRGCPLTM